MISRFSVVAWLALLLAGNAGAAPGSEPAGIAPAGGLMTATDLDQFTGYYYRNPRPDRVAAMIQSLAPAGLLAGRTAVFSGFFAELFAANPERVTEWRKLLEAHNDELRAVSKAAWKLRQPGALLAAREHSVELNERYWGAFFASGNPAYLRKLAGEMKFIDGESRPLFMAGATAKWSLARNVPAHPVIRTTLEAMRPDADARTAGNIAAVLNPDLPAIRQEIAGIRRTRKFLDYPNLNAMQDYRTYFPHSADWIAGNPPRVVWQW